MLGCGVAAYGLAESAAPGFHNPAFMGKHLFMNTKPDTDSVEKLRAIQKHLVTPYDSESVIMQGHTPGPWQVLGSYVTTAIDPEGELVIAVTANHVNQVAFAAGIATFENAANARLIAAAPDLYILRKADISGADVGTVYTRGVAVY
jgi:hypothetical protein